MPLRRDEISKKVIGSQRGAFKVVFEEAQKILRGTFGMELVELPTRTATHDTAGGVAGKDKTQEKAGTQNGDEGAGDRQAVTGLRKKGTVYVRRLFEIPAPSLFFQSSKWMFVLIVLQLSRRVPRRTSFVRRWIPYSLNARR